MHSKLLSGIGLAKATQLQNPKASAGDEQAHEESNDGYEEKSQRSQVREPMRHQRAMHRER
jgi:hypothetical protein